MKTMLLSFDAETFAELESNKMKFEYRKVLPAEEMKVYFYVTRPVMAISGVAHFGQRENLANWKERFADRSIEVLNRIDDYLTDCKYVVPILDFQRTNRISLKQLTSDLPDFIVPRMYYFIDDTSLNSYLEKNLIPTSDLVVNTFDRISDDDICS